MLNAMDKQTISKEELLSGISECHAIEQHLCAVEGQAELKQLLHQCQDIIIVTPGGIKLLCKENDSRKVGRLMPLDCAALLRMTVPLLPKQLRTLLAHMHTFDVDCTGNLSTEEVTLALSPEPFFTVTDVGNDAPLPTPKVTSERRSVVLEMQRTMTAGTIALDDDDTGSPQSARWSVGQMLSGPPNASHDWHLTKTQVCSIMCCDGCSLNHCLTRWPQPWELQWHGVLPAIAVWRCCHVVPVLSIM